MLLIFVRQLASPNNKVLFSGLSPADAQSIAAQLAAKNIPHQIDPAGTEISVPTDQLDAARLEVASQGMPHSGRMGFEIFDKVSWGQTEFDEKVNYQRALEGELERTIQGSARRGDGTGASGDARGFRIHRPATDGQGGGNPETSSRCDFT